MSSRSNEVDGEDSVSAKCDKIIEAAVAWAEAQCNLMSIADDDFDPENIKKATDAVDAADKSLMEAVDAANLLPGEPIFVLRGKDRAAPHGINGWRYEAFRLGALPANLKDADARYAETLAWQNANPDKVKIPD